MRLPHTKQHCMFTRSLSGVCVLSIVFWSLPVGAADQAIPWECTGFAGEAQSRCVRTVTELQQEKIAQLERDLETQQRTVQQLQQQVTRHATATADLERQLTRKRSRWYSSPFVQIYPPIGLTLRFGRGTIYGGSHYYGPRFYGYGHRRWHRH